MLEYAVYSGIVSFLALAATHGAWLMVCNLRAYQMQQHVTLQAVTLMNTFTRDLWQAVPERWSERVITDHEARWFCSTYEVGWVLKGTDLFRVMGSYDRVRGRWHTSHRSLIARQVKFFLIDDRAQGSSEVVGVRCVVVFHHAAGKKEFSWIATSRIAL